MNLKSFELDKSTGDLKIDSLYNINIIQGKEEFMQRLWINLNTQLGEWIGNKNFGLDFLGKMELKGKMQDLIEEIRVLIQSYTEVSFIDEITYVKNTERNYTITVKFTLTDGAKTEMEVII